MPRSNASQVSSALHQIQGKARQVLRSVDQEIRAKEAELRRLRDDRAELVALAGNRNVAVSRSSQSASGRFSDRINWRVVLEKLPKEFKTSHIRAVPGIKDKRLSEVFAAITRWIDAKLVNRKSRGIYERVDRKSAKR